MSLTLSQLLTLVCANTYFKTVECHCCHPLFLTCKGSTLTLSIALPSKGGNSCRDFFCAMNEVTFCLMVAGLRCEPELPSSSFFLATAPATAILCA